MFSLRQGTRSALQTASRPVFETATEQQQQQERGQPASLRHGTARAQPPVGAGSPGMQPPALGPPPYPQVTGSIFGF